MDYELCKQAQAALQNHDFSIPDSMEVYWNSEAGPYHKFTRVEVSFPQCVLKRYRLEQFIGMMYGLRAIADLKVHTIVIHIHDASAFVG
jgi:hypothetical protein